MGAGTAADDPLVQLIRAGRTLFSDLEFLAPSGILQIATDQPAVDRLRIELPPGQFLHLQSLAIDSDVEDLSGIATLEASSWYETYGERFSLQRLFDFAQPTGTVVHTQADTPAWVEVRFARPIHVRAIWLRNVGIHTAPRAAGIRLLSHSAGEWSELYDQQRRIQLLERVLNEWARVLPAPDGPEPQALARILILTMTGRYKEAREAFDAISLSNDHRKQFRSVISTELLAHRGLEWTIHGPQRCFRFWSEPEKLRYVQFTAELTEVLAELTPNVCFGFGSALAAVRDGDLIPHDDDLDLIIGFETFEADSLPRGLHRLENFLRARGYTVTGNFSAHRQVTQEERKRVDVFVGLFEGETISWYPGARGSLTRQIMFPPSDGSLLGVPVRLPRSPLLYLERLYGPGWRHPDPNFKHSWDRSAYSLI